jgi:hypothetical protein
MRHPALPYALAAATAVLLAGCGSDATSTATTVTTPGSDDAAQSGASSAAVGSASDAGVSQLFSGGTAAMAMIDPHPVVAWQLVRRDGMDDGPAPLDALVKSSDTAPAPNGGSTTITAGPNFGGPGCSGSFPCEIDTGGTLPAGYYHVALTFDTAHTLTLHTENGDTATITGGELDLYVKGTDVTPSGHPLGSWDYIIDVYSTMPATNPIVVNVTTANGGSWTTRVNGLRHGKREYVRSQTGIGAGAVVSLTESFTVDGDFSGFPAGTTVPNPGNGPLLLDRGNSQHNFTKWVFNSVGAAGGSHVFTWDRYATFGLNYVRTGGTALTVSVTAPAENIYITKDTGLPVGPLDLAGLKAQYHVSGDLTQSAASY